MSVVLTIAAIMVMLALNALYVAAEFATVGSRKSRIQTSAQDGNRSAATLLNIVRDPVALDNYVAACQVGITLSSLVAGAFAQARLTPIFEPWFGSAGRWVAVLVTLLIITALQVVLGELLPKTAALRYPERLAMATLRPMQVSQFLFRPLVMIFNGSAFLLMRLAGLNADHGHAHVHSAEEIAALARASADGGLIEASERDMVAGVLTVEQRVAREIMTPRPRLVGVDLGATIGESLDKVVETPHSRFPVWDAKNDDVAGVVYLRDLYLRAQDNPGAPVSTVVRPLLEVAETLTVAELWRRLDDNDRHCAFVINEFGGVAGMVTAEDALEEIFGEVRDEFDIDPDPIEVSGGRVSTAGGVLLADLNTRFALNLGADGVDTIGGLVWHQLGRPPSVGEQVALDDTFTVRVDAIDGNTIERVSFVQPGAEQ